MRIEKLASKPDRVGRYRVELEDGTILRLYWQTVQDHCIYAGAELTEEALAALRSDAGRMSAKMRAVRILTASDVSKDDLKHRLIQKGENPGDAADAVSWMEELQLVDDRKTAAQIVSRCAAKGYGAARARQALYEKRIPKEFWEEALSDYPDQTECVVDYLRTHLPPDSDERSKKRVLDALVRRGHSYSDIRAALRRLDMDEFQEDWNG